MTYPNHPDARPLTLLAILSPRTAEMTVIRQLVQRGCQLLSVIGCHALTLHAEATRSQCEWVVRHRTAELEMLLSLWSLSLDSVDPEASPQLVIVQSTSKSSDTVFLATPEEWQSLLEVLAFCEEARYAVKLCEWYAPSYRQTSAH